MKFHPFMPLDTNAGQKKFWEVLKAAFGSDEGVAYYRYAIFSRSGQKLKEPDFLMLHRELGLWVFESKGCRIQNIAAIQGHEWQMNNWHQEYETPVSQVEDAMWAVRSKFESRQETRGFLRFNYQVVTPFIKRQEWQLKRFSELAGIHETILFEEDCSPQGLKELLLERSHAEPQKVITDEQWGHAIAFLGGELPRKEPRPVPTNTSQDNPIRVIHTIESQLKFLDEQQQKVAFEAPDGPQRIRGLAGTGKTVLFAKRAAKMHAAHPDWKIAFVFFTQALYDQILELIDLYYREMTNEEPDWNQIKVLHAWGTRQRMGFYRNLAQKSGKRPKSVNDVRQETGEQFMSPAESFEYVCDRLEEDVPNPPQLFDAILIDEGQDLPPSFYRLALNTLSNEKRLYWAYDEAQGIGSLIVPKAAEIFGRKANGMPVVDLGGNKLPNGETTLFSYPEGIAKAHNMNRCYRTPKMLLMTAHAINMGLYRQGGPLQGVTTQEDWRKLGYTILDGNFSPSSVKQGKLVKITREGKNSPHPIDQDNFPAKEALHSPLTIHTLNSEAEEQEWIAAQVAKDIAQGMDPWDLLITGPTGNRERQYHQGIQKALKKHGVKSVIAGVDTERDIFRMNGYVTIAPIFRAKGNEAWKVYACRFHCADQPLAYKRDEEEIHKRNEAFVALTRARVWCVVTGVKDPIFQELRAIQEDSPYLVFPAFNRSSLRRNNEDEASGEEPSTEAVQPQMALSL